MKMIDDREVSGTKVTFQYDLLQCLGGAFAHGGLIGQVFVGAVQVGAEQVDGWVEPAESGEDLHPEMID